MFAHPLPLAFAIAVATVLPASAQEASVATVTETTYSTFISKLLNQVKHEIEQAYYWNALRDTYAVNTVAGTTSYTFTGAGPDARVLNGWNMTSPCPLKRGTNTQFDKWYFGVLAADIQTGATTHYIPAGVSADYDLKVDVWPKPDAVYALSFNVYVPQADLSDASDVALVPQNLLIEETIARAMIERGDEMAPKPERPGETFILSGMLATEAARESGHDDDESDWVPE